MRLGICYSSRKLRDLGLLMQKLDSERDAIFFTHVIKLVRRIKDRLRKEFADLANDATQ